MNSVEQFFFEVSQDPTLQQQLQSLENREARLNKMVDLGQQKGYNFTPIEVEQWLQSRSQELSESELEGVAGGFTLTGMNKKEISDFQRAYQEQQAIFDSFGL